MVRGLFDDHIPDGTQNAPDAPEAAFRKREKEGTSLDRLKNLEEKIAGAISKVKMLKEEKLLLERRIKELEEQLDEKNQEVEKLSSEKFTVKAQVEELLNELEALDLD
jgi:chromosome segregation ATPase